MIVFDEYVDVAERFRDAIISLYRACSNIWERLKTLAHDLSNYLIEYFEEKQQIDRTRDGWFVPAKSVLSHQVLNRKPLIIKVRSNC